MSNIRKAAECDLAALTAIYNQAITDGKCTADITPLTVEERRPWFISHGAEKYPLYVYEKGGSVLGYAYLSPYREREALLGTAEISYYVNFSHHREGIGKNLVSYTIDVSRQLGYDNLLAILLGCNTPSIALLTKLGFEKWGEMPKIAKLNGKQYSHLYYGLKL